MKKKEKPKKSGRPPLFIDDASVILSERVPSKEYDNIKKMVLDYRKQFEVKK